MAHRLKDLKTKYRESKKVLPTLTIEEQPQHVGARFRYTCESKCSRELYGDKSRPENISYPKVRIKNFDSTMGEAKVYVWCAEARGRNYPHPHALVSKNDDQSMPLGIIKGEFDHNNVYQLKDVAIHIVKREDHLQSLKMRRTIDGFPKTKDAKNPDPSMLCLCFQGVIYDSSKAPKMLEPVYSDVIINKKECPEPKIIETSDLISSVKGNRKIMIFCNKVGRFKVEVHFKKVNGEVFGKVKPEAFHQGVAFTIKTPPFPYEITEPETVHMYLYNPATNMSSEIKKFLYVPSKFVGVIPDEFQSTNDSRGLSLAKKIQSFGKTFFSKALRVKSRATIDDILVYVLDHLNEIEQNAASHVVQNIDSPSLSSSSSSDNCESMEVEEPTNKYKGYQQLQAPTNRVQQYNPVSTNNHFQDESRHDSISCDPYLSGPEPQTVNWESFTAQPTPQQHSNAYKTKGILQVAKSQTYKHNQTIQFVETDHSVGIDVNPYYDNNSLLTTIINFNNCDSPRVPCQTTNLHHESFEDSDDSMPTMEILMNNTAQEPPFASQSPNCQINKNHEPNPNSNTGISTSVQIDNSAIQNDQTQGLHENCTPGSSLNSIISPIAIQINDTSHENLPVGLGRNISTILAETNNATHHEFDSELNFITGTRVDVVNNSSNLAFIPDLNFITQTRVTEANVTTQPAFGSDLNLATGARVAIANNTTHQAFSPDQNIMTETRDAAVNVATLHALDSDLNFAIGTSVAEAYGTPHVNCTFGLDNNISTVITQTNDTIHENQLFGSSQNSNWGVGVGQRIQCHEEASTQNSFPNIRYNFIIQQMKSLAVEDQSKSCQGNKTDENELAVWLSRLNEEELSNLMNDLNKRLTIEPQLHYDRNGGQTQMLNHDRVETTENAGVESSNLFHHGTHENQPMQQWIPKSGAESGAIPKRRI